MKINYGYSLPFVCLIVLGCGSSASDNSSASSNTPPPTSSPQTGSTSNNSPSKTDSQPKSAPIDPSKDISEAELGLPYYPGSIMDVKGNNFKFVKDSHKQYDTERLTDDEPKKVADFYKEKVKGLKMVGAGDQFKVDGKLDSGAKVLIGISKQDGKTHILASTVLN